MEGCHAMRSMADLLVRWLRERVLSFVRSKSFMMFDWSD